MLYMEEFDLGKSVEDAIQLLPSEELCIIKAIKAFHGGLTDSLVFPA